MGDCVNCKHWKSKKGVYGRCKSLSDITNKVAIDDIDGKMIENPEVKTKYDFGCKNYEKK